MSDKTKILMGAHAVGEDGLFRKIASHDTMIRGAAEIRLWICSPKEQVVEITVRVDEDGNLTVDHGKENTV